jgi:alpha-L-fucosidase 2
MIVRPLEIVFTSRPLLLAPWLGLVVFSLGIACSSGGSNAGPGTGSGGVVSSGGSNSHAGNAQGGANGGGQNLAGSAGTGMGGTFGAAGSAGTSSMGGSAGVGGGTPAPTTVIDGPTGEAFDPKVGLLDIDYANYLSKHDVVYNQENTNPLYGLTVGNGRMGAMVWSANGLTMQVGNVDESQQNAFSAGLVNLSTTPALNNGATGYQQRLALYDGVLTTRYANDRTVTILGNPGSEVMGIHVEDARTGLTNIALDLSLWDVSTLNNFGNVPDLNTWKQVSTYADATGAGLSRGQTDANHFGYTLAATVEGTNFTTQMVNGSQVRLNITPAPSYTIWFAAATRLNAPNNDSVAAAKKALSDTKTAGYATISGQLKSFWHAQWQKSFIQFSDPSATADYYENVYYLTSYIIMSGGFGNYPFHFINGVYRATQDNTKWSNAYWYWNQRDVYNSFPAANHADVLHVFNNMYSRNFDALKAFTLSRFNIDGIWVPETMSWNGNADGTIYSTYTDEIYSSGTEAAENMYAEYEYTGDENYLTNTVYPFMREIAKFYSKKLTLDSGSGKYIMAESNSHETYWKVKNAITDLAAVRSMFPIAIAVSTKLGLDADLRATWQNVLTNLVPYATDGTNYLPMDPPVAQTRNDENVACELIWPYSVTGIGAPDYDMALATFKNRPFKYDNVWANDAIQAARLGLGDEVMNGLKTMLQRYASYPNLFTNNTNGVFEYMGVHLSVMNEALLQSYNGKIRVFPALPSEGGFVGRFTLLAKGGFLVSSERESGEIKYVGIKSLRGGTAHVVNPWGTEAVNVRKMSDDSVLSMTSSAEFDIVTDAGGVYVIERVAKPFKGYTYAMVTGMANQGQKALPGTPSTLGTN